MFLADITKLPEATLEELLDLRRRMIALLRRLDVLLGLPMTVVTRDERRFLQVHYRNGKEGDDDGD